MSADLHGGTAPLAALTTVFTPPCPTSWLVTTTKLPSQFPSFPSANVAVPTCDPPGWAGNLAGEGFQYYSPAICPDGFEVGDECILTGTPRTTEGFPAVAPGETVAWCVPSGQTCTSDTTDFRGGVWGVLQTSTGAGATITVGPAIQIRFRDVDLSILATHPLTPGRILPGGKPLTQSTRPPSPTPPPTKQTPDAFTSSSEIAQNTQLPSSPSSSSSSPSTTSTATSDGTAVGFMTVIGKSTTASLSSAPEPVTSTVQVVSHGLTFKSTVVTSPTPSANNGGDGGDDSTGATATNSTSNALASKTPTSAFTATIVMAVILSVAAAAIACFFLLSRRRNLRQQQKPSEQGRGLPNTEPPVHDGNSSLGWSSVGVGAWVHRRRPRWQAGWRRLRAWWSSLPRLPWQRRSTHTGDNRRWAGWRRPVPRRHNQNAEDREPGRARTPMAELPTSEHVVADYAELEGSPVPQRQVSYNDNDDDADSYMSIQKFKGIPARRMNAHSPTRANRLSWMSRLSRYMRGRSSTGGGDGRDTPASRGTSVYDDAATVADRSILSRASTRSSHWTRSGEVDDSPFGTMDSNDVDESSWEVFSRSREGLGRLLQVKKSAGSPMPAPFGARRGHQRGLSAPTNSTAKGLPRLPSPAITVRSDRTGTPVPGWLGGANGANTDRFSRLSSGTFGRMDSFISRDGSRIGDVPGVGAGGAQYTEANP
ncbi:hypothetical protein HMPREF1624_02663 [Sporothrix schenckii ATCC 58251]|uniref:Uncharacterized protein n=1 Tax=Sporothrix schenckii (strain ATCC 58251 / de Perez 2211183) TaxID=1391915 RepID=U7Q2N8_SPOS1|nr:hypothetical protein HMPREF1624_02663 [Sporothrix schenckii ATCC 58251]